MSKKILVLTKEPNPNEIVFNYLFWLDVPTNYQSFYVNSNATSSYRDATTQEVDSLKAGQVYELQGNAVFSKTDTVANIKAFLITRFHQEQEILDAKNPWIYYGTFWDGTSWTNGGVV